MLEKKDQQAYGFGDPTNVVVGVASFVSAERAGGGAMSRHALAEEALGLALWLWSSHIRRGESRTKRKPRANLELSNNEALY